MLAIVITLSLVSGGFASILCPTVFNPNQTIHLPHPTSCSKFLTCVGSHPVEQDCPAGLHWNGEHSRCDYPGTPRCTRGSDSKQSFNAAAVASSVCLPQTNQCPLNSNPTEHVIFLKHHDCRKFYACVSTHQVEMSCPPKLYWNSRSCVCDYEMEAECDEMMARIEEDAPVEADEQEEDVPQEADQEEEDAPQEAGEEEHPIGEEDAPEEADQEQLEPEVNDYAEASAVARKRRATDGSSSSSNDTSTGSGSGSSGSGSSGAGSSGSGSSGSGSSGSGSSGSGSNGSGSSGSITPSGADIRSVSAIVMVVTTVIMSAL